jgi:hypothetical protein
MAEQLWNILIKRYIDKGEWEKKFENEIVNYMNLEYIKENNGESTVVAQTKDEYWIVTKEVHRKKSQLRGNKGCIAQVVTLVKRDILKLFNHVAAKSQEITLTLVNPIVTYQDDGNKRYKKQNIKSMAFTSEIHLKKHKVHAVKT